MAGFGKRSTTTGRLLRIALAPAALAAVLCAWFGTAGARDDTLMQASIPRRRGLAVFVVDASASMRIKDAGGAGVSRLDAARAEVLETIEGLRSKGEFLFDVVVCSSVIETLSGSMGVEGPLKLDDSGASAAASFLASRKAAGTTRLYDALSAGFEICANAPPRFAPGTIIAFTDGVPSYPHSGEKPDNTEEFLSEIAAANTGGVRINAHAICATSESVAFLEKLCAEHRGILFVRRPYPEKHGNE